MAETVEKEVEDAEEDVLEQAESSSSPHQLETSLHRDLLQEPLFIP